jgi:ribose transport system ATP-binding protein
LADALFGVIPHAGELIANGRAIKRGGIAGRLKRRIAMVPRNRKERGILTDLSIYDNLAMGFFNTLMKSPLINIREVRDRYINRQASLNIKAENPKDRITSLSGGNQQKVILGRWLEIDADVLIFDNPTQGIDVGTKFEIYRLLIDLAKSGKAIMVFSSEYPEIYKVADRCAVMYKGEMNALINRADITESGLMYYSTGSKMEGAQYA